MPKIVRCGRECLVMASAVATCGFCGTVLTSFNSAPLIFTGNKIISSHHHAASWKLRKSGGITARAADEEDRGKEYRGKEDEKDSKISLLTSITDALDFAQTRSEEDAQLIAEAREATRSGERMSREQYAALRRKIGGTYKDFFKDSVEVIGDYVDDGWVDKTCRVCKKDTSNDPRTKDGLGRYAHVACVGNEKSGNFFTRLFGK